MDGAGDLAPGGLVATLVAAGVRRGGRLALVVEDAGGIAVATDADADADAWTVDGDGDPIAVVAELEAAFRPRWVWWSQDTAAGLVAAGLRPATCWDLAAVHRLLFGGWKADPGRIWAALSELPDSTMPALGQLELLGAASGGTDGDGGDAEDPIRPDGHLRPEWTSGGWSRTPARRERWARLAIAVAAAQERCLTALRVGGDPHATARSESAAELLCAELAIDGLPVDRERAEQIIGSFIGPRPRDEAQAVAQRDRRDDEVLRHAAPGSRIDLRNPAQVRGMLAGVGIEVPDTRSWRLEPYVGAHPIVEALLTWRRAERIATTYGYRFVDERIPPDGRLRGAWSGSDGAAGRMTAQAGLHNLPGELRAAVVAEPGFAFVQADLGQIEPRILAAVSGDQAFARAAADDDLYAPVAARLAVERPVAKVAVLAAMYGGTSGNAGQALRGLESAYPVAMRFLNDAYEAGRAGRDVRTHGGRLVRMWPTPAALDEAAQRASVASRGRYARNAVIQGAAAEFFKAWAATVRARTAPFGARIVLCLHDELLVHAPTQAADKVAALLTECLDETAAGWPAAARVRFVADVVVVARWSDAKN